MTNAERIKEIEDRAAKATHGAWFLHDFTGPEINNIPSSRDVTVSCDHPATITVAEMGRGLTGALEEARANASFIAHSRTDIAFLLSTLRAVEADNARLRGALEVCVEVLCESANLNNYRNLSDEELGRAWMTAHTLGTAALQDPRP